MVKLVSYLLDAGLLGRACCGIEYAKVMRRLLREAKTDSSMIWGWGCGCEEDAGRVLDDVGFVQMQRRISRCYLCGWLWRGGLWMSFRLVGRRCASL